MLHTDIIDFRSYDSKKSVTSHISCTEEDYALQVTNYEYNTREETGELPNAFGSGQIWNPGKRITSTDKKFTMELERSGNLVIKRYTEVVWQTKTDYLKDYDTRVRITEKGHLLFKDGTRTMWSSKPADLWFAKAPYSMFLNHKGEIVVRDSQGYYIWQTANMDLESKGPFEMKIEDEGKISIYDNEKKFVWGSWDGEPKSLFFMFKEPVLYCYNKCDKCKTDNPDPKPDPKPVTKPVGEPDESYTCYRGGVKDWPKFIDGIMLAWCIGQRNYRPFFLMTAL